MGTERLLLVGSSFALTAGSEQGGFGALWGRAAVSRLDSRAGDLSLDGGVTSAMVGADWTRERATAGLLVSHSRGEEGYRSPRSRGEVESTLTGVYPYGRYRVALYPDSWSGSGVWPRSPPSGRRRFADPLGILHAVKVNAAFFRIMEDRPAKPKQAFVVLQSVVVRAHRIGRHMEGMGGAEHALEAAPVPVPVT